MIKQALEYLAWTLKTDASSRTVESVSGDQCALWALEQSGETYSFRELTPHAPYRCETLGVNTLSGVIRYLKENRDGHDLSKVSVLVAGERDVHVIGPLDRVRKREMIIHAIPASDRVDGLDGFIEQSKMILNIQRFFVDDQERAELLKLIGNLENEEIKTTVDDGVSQVATTRSAARLASTVIKNPWSLKPCNSFPEIEPVARSFILRVMHSPNEIKVALFNADGGRGKVATINMIRDYLAKETSDAKGAWAVIG